MKGRPSLNSLGCTQALSETHLQSVAKHQAEAPTGAGFHFTQYVWSSQQMQPRLALTPSPSHRWDVLKAGEGFLLPP